MGVADRHRLIKKKAQGKDLILYNLLSSSEEEINHDCIVFIGNPHSISRSTTITDFGQASFCPLLQSI